jgi:hypothetical protein
MPNHDVPIEEANLWDILSWNKVCELAATAPNDPRDEQGTYVLATVAKMLIDAGVNKDSDEGERILLRFAPHWIGYGEDAIRRQRAGALARKLGAREDRFIEYLAYKKGLFGRAKRS